MRRETAGPASAPAAVRSFSAAGAHPIGGRLAPRRIPHRHGHLRVRELAERRADFAFESALSGRTLHTFLRRLTRSGYQCHIFYLWLPSADLAVARVRRRVEAGGHDVPERVIQRRFGKSLVNFYRLYRPAANAWRLYDGSVIGRQRLVAHGKRGHDATVVDAELWAAVRGRIEEAS